MIRPAEPGPDRRWEGVARTPGRSSRRWAAASTVLLLVGYVDVAIAGWTPRSQATAPTVESPAPVPVTRRATSAAPAPVTPVVVPRSAPVALHIPAIGLAVSVSKLGVNADGTVQVPTNFAEPGWFRLGPSPGQTGSAVILGHVDSYDGPAVFFRLRSLRAGDRVEVRLANGTVRKFQVNLVATYHKKKFPARLVYGSRGYSALHLVTCGGVFDSRTRSYLSNVVVYTTMVGGGPA